jgi:hypothetical protein
MNQEERQDLDAALDIPMLAAWDQSWDGSTPHPTGFVGAAAAGRPLVAVDGVEVGVAPLWLRVSPGRHHVAVESSGSWGPGSWSEVEPSKKVLAELSSAKPSRNRARARRRARMIRDIEASGAVRGCVRGLEKRGLAEGAYLELEMGMGARSVHFLNILRTDLPPPVAACVRRVIGRLALPSGPALELRHRLQF